MALKPRLGTIPATMTVGLVCIGVGLLALWKMDDSFHADLGYSTSTAPGKVPNGQPWETSTGLYGNWDPITYRYLSPDGDQRIDLTPVEWLKLNAARIVGEAVKGRDGVTVGGGDDDWAKASCPAATASSELNAAMGRTCVGCSDRGESSRLSWRGSKRAHLGRLSLVNKVTSSASVALVRSATT